MMKQSIILGMGTGRCGLASLAELLSRQTEAGTGKRDITGFRVVLSEAAARTHVTDTGKM
jgi:hypothetical protein